MLDLIWETDAAEQYAAILDFIAGHRPAAAARIEQMFDVALARTCRFPRIGRPGRVSGTRELIVHPNYICIYRITDEAIDVLRVLHARQRYP